MSRFNLVRGDRPKRLEGVMYFGHFSEETICYWEGREGAIGFFKGHFRAGALLRDGTEKSGFVVGCVGGLSKVATV